MILADLFCSGSEDSILDCQRNDYGLQNCTASEVAGVQCEGNECVCHNRSITHTQRCRGCNTCMIKNLIELHQYLAIASLFRTVFWWKSVKHGHY